jgi:hypothetical protein
MRRPLTKFEAVLQKEGHRFILIAARLLALASCV